SDVSEIAAVTDESSSGSADACANSSSSLTTPGTPSDVHDRPDDEEPAMRNDLNSIICPTYDVRKITEMMSLFNHRVSSMSEEIRSLKEQLFTNNYPGDIETPKAAVAGESSLASIVACPTERAINHRRMPCTCKIAKKTRQNYELTLRLAQSEAAMQPMLQLHLQQSQQPHLSSIAMTCPGVAAAPAASVEPSYETFKFRKTDRYLFVVFFSQAES
ncbi:hypothetical protein PENTCL1PPCAC_24019, partial [Pristionchus entomophagus]